MPTNAEKSKDEDLTVSTNSGNLERAGYTFNGWNTKVDGTGTAYAGGSTFTDNKEATFYAEWRANQYTVTFNGNEGTPLFENKEVTYGQAYGVLATASRTGYEFAGWYATETGGIEITSSTTVAITAAQTLYAQWRANTTTVYTVYHYYKDGIGDNYTVTYTDTLTGTTGAEVTATAKSYGGFSEDVSHTSRIASGTIAADGTLVLKLYYDRVTYTVSFDSIGGSAVPDTTDILYGGTIFKPTDPTLSNYTFGAWYKDAALTKAWNFTSDTITKNITLYARWMAQGDIAYTVEHYQQNENGSGYSLHETEHLTGLTGTTAYASLKHYDGFKENTSHASRVPSGEITSDGTLVLKLYYDRITLITYTVSFDSNGGSTVSNTTNVLYGTIISKPSTDPTLIGYSFDSWYKEESLTNQWNFLSDTVTEETTLYAKWRANTNTLYTVEHWHQEIIGSSYTLKETVNLIGTTGETVNATARVYDGFTENTEHANTVASNRITADGTLVLKLYYDRDTYTVQFDSTGGSAVVSSTGVRHGATITKPVNPTKAGYSFDSWYKESALANAWNFSSDTVTGETTLYAKWRANTNTAYTVEHWQQEINGSSYTLKETVNLTGTTGGTVNATAKSYGGFSENESHTSRVASGTIAADGTLVLKLYYDRVTYTVSFASNGGSAVPNTTGVKYGTKISKPTSDPTRDGYTFGAWFKEEALVNGWNFLTDTVTENTTLYASWAAQGDTAYTVKHYQQNVSRNGYTLVEADTENLTGLTDATVYASPKSYEGFIENTSHTSRKASGTIAGTGLLQLSVYYDRKTYTVSLDKQGGTGGTGSVSVPFGVAMPTASVTAPTRSGYTFGGYYDAVSDGGTLYYTNELTSTKEWNSADDGALYAKWDPVSYTITYELYEGTNDAGNPAAYTVEDETITLEDPTRDSYGFYGWFGNSDCTGNAVTEIAQGSTGNKTLYAKWALLYPITYVLDGGTNHADNPSAYTEEDTITLKDPTKHTYVFYGWFVEDSIATEDKVSRIPEGSTEAKTLYAQWKIKPGTIGEAGGLVFYDDLFGYDLNGDGTIEANEKDLLDGTNDGVLTGKRYLETAPAGWKTPGGDDPKICFGFYRPSGTWGGENVMVGGTETGIGSGEANTKALVVAINSGKVYDNSWLTTKAPNYAAKVADDYSLTVGGNTYDDWFLPSIDELAVMYEYLHRGKVLGGFYWALGNLYWSSSEVSATNAWRKNFQNDEIPISNLRSEHYFVRPVRAFGTSNASD